MTNDQAVEDRYEEACRLEAGGYNRNADFGDGRVVHVNDKVPGAVYVGRRVGSRKASPLGNPYKIGVHGNRDECLQLYRIYIASEVTRGDPATLEALITARGKPLACWCRHDGEERTAQNDCHADILLAVLEENDDDAILARRIRVP